MIFKWLVWVLSLLTVASMAVAGASRVGHYDILDMFNGAHQTVVTAGTLAGDTAFTLPPTNGSAGYFLQTNGSGVTSWQNVPVLPAASNTVNGYLASTDWIIFNNKAAKGANSDITSLRGITGNVGIGGAPVWPLDITETATAGAGAARTESITGLLNASANNDTLTGLYVYPTYAANTHTGLKEWSAQFIAKGGGGLYIDWDQTVNTNVLQIDNTTTPETMYYIDAGANSWTHGGYYADGDGAKTAGNVAYGYEGDTGHSGLFWPANNVMAISTNSAERMRFDSAGNIGIGSATPAGALDIEKAYTTTATPAGAVHVGSAVTAHANNDFTSGLYVNPTFASGGHSGVVPAAIYAQGNSAEALLLSTDGNYSYVMQVVDQGTETFRMYDQGFMYTDGSGANSASVPSYGFLLDQHTGMYLAGTGVLSFTAGSTERGRFTSAGEVVFGGLQLSTSASKPTCDSTKRGMLYSEQGGAGVTDTLFTCLKSAADTYSWVSIVTGS